MKIVGLTGGIATGKSTVSTILKEQHGLIVIDADVLARKVVEPGTSGFQKIVDYFGPTTPDLLDKEGRLNRPALGRRIFNHEPDRKKLNGIVHPLVRRAMLKALLWYYMCGYDMVILDVPLLFESRLDRFCTTSLVVGCENETQRARLLARDAHLTEQDADSRIAAQMDIKDKCKRAGHVIWNEGTKQDLQKEVTRMVHTLRPSRLRSTLEWMGTPAAIGVIILGICGARSRLRYMYSTYHALAASLQGT